MKNNPRVVFCFKKKNIFSFEKNGPGEFKYGLDYIQKSLPVSSLFSGRYHLAYLFFRALEKIITKKALCGIYFQFYLNNKKKIKKNDLLFAINDGVSLGLLFFKLLRKFDNEITVIIQGLHDRYKYFKNNKLLVNFYKRLLGRAEMILTLSKYERGLLVKSFELEPQKVKVFYFGTDINYWSKTRVGAKDKAGDFVLTVGSDMHRDYNLLLNHYRLKMPLKFVTRILTKRQLNKVEESDCFETDKNISNEKLRNLYFQSRFVVVPLKNTLATSGLSTVLQALAMEKPVLLAKTPAIQELFEDYKHVLYYEEKNPTSFKEKLDELNGDKRLRERLAKNGRKLVEEKFNSENMGKQVLRMMKSFVNF